MVVQSIPSEHALGIAAQCWCDPATEHIVMDSELAKAFAIRLDDCFDLLNYGWGIIANAGHGDWETESEEWQEAAKTWRERYHALIGIKALPLHEDEPPGAPQAP